MRDARLNVTLKILIAFGVCAGLAMGGGVDAGLLSLAPPDSKILIGIQVSQAQASPIGQYLMSQLPLSATNPAMAAAGFDPRRDLREVLGASGEGSSMVLLGRGTFQPERISKAAVAAGAVSSTYRGVAMLTFNGTKPAGSLAFLDGSTVTAGDTMAVKAVLDRRAAKGVFNGTLAESARQISSANDAWVVTLAPPASMAAGVQGGEMIQNLLQAALQLSAGVKFAATEVTVSAEVLARSAPDAQSMTDLLKFLVAMVPSQGAPNAKAPSLADSAKISSTGSTVHVVITMPEQQVEQLILPKANSAPKKVALR
jgi:hypothetical protein